MKGNKYFVFISTVIGASIVIYNNFIDLLERLFNPEFNILYIIGLGLIIFGYTMYVIHNMD